jgi:glycosyltransferase involved in cell wall biosynthesis
VVVDAIPIRPGSVSTIIGNLLIAWATMQPDDELIVLVDDHPQLPLPPSAVVKAIGGAGSSVAGLWARSVGVQRACRRLRPDALLSGVTATSFLGGAHPHGVVLYDLRHELRPEQFETSRRLARRLLYGWSFRRADAVICISERTRGDLLARRPRLSARAYVAPLGADHALQWQASSEQIGPYVLAFGHFPNKNVEGVLRAWRAYADRHDEHTLRICGLGKAARADAARLVSELSISDRVELLPWLNDEEFGAIFAGARAVLFPSDFEGFGMPAAEAMLLGIPVVVSADPALLEVTDGHAVVTADDSPESLAVAIEQALERTPEQLAAAVEQGSTWTWERMARQARDALVRADRQAQNPTHSG